MVELHPTLGDPIRVLSTGETTIWRYLTHGNGIYLDVIVKNNVAQSVTVLSRSDGVRYVDPKGIAFGMTPDQVRAKLGSPSRESTNADDGSLDLSYFELPYAWIYEFHSNKLDFIQLIAAPSLLKTFSPGAAAAPNDGTSLERAIWIRPSNFLSNALWIDAFLATNPCDGDGHWKETSTKLAPDRTNNDPLAYTIVHARCTGGDERDFYFDTHGTASRKGNTTTIYVDPNHLRDTSPSTTSSPSPEPTPHGSPQ
ncbi:MAG: hypothetical protein WB615_04500 [Candidatus Tumulicola sp.]